MASRIETYLSQATLVRGIRDGYEESRSYNRMLFPVTALQVFLSRICTEKFEKLIHSHPRYEQLREWVKRKVIQHYTKLERPLAMTEKTALFLKKGTQALTSVDASPYLGPLVYAIPGSIKDLPEALTLILGDVSVAAQDLRTLFRLEPRLIAVIDQIERIAKEEILDFLTKECTKKLTPPVAPTSPAPTPPSSPSKEEKKDDRSSPSSPSWWDRTRAFGRGVWESASHAYTAASELPNRALATALSPLKHKAYETLPGLADTALSKSTATLRAHIPAQKQNVENRYLPKITDLAISKMVYFASFTGVNWLMGKMIRWTADTAVRTSFHDQSEEDIDYYTNVIVTSLYYTYLTIACVSYAARISAWKKQRMQAQATAQYTQATIGGPILSLHKSATESTQSIVDQVRGAISATGEFLDIDISSAVKRFESRVASEVKF